VLTVVEGTGGCWLQEGMGEANIAIHRGDMLGIELEPYGQDNMSVQSMGYAQRPIPGQEVDFPIRLLSRSKGVTVTVHVPRV